MQIQLESNALILMYHRVLDANSDPWALCVTPAHFAEHLEVLSHHTTPIPLQKLAKSLENGTIPHRAVAITFDDGYADNHSNAKPLLERYNVPATIFLVSGYLGQLEFWWDFLERIFLGAGKLPQVLQLNVNGSTHRWNLSDVAEYSEEMSHQYRGWKAWEQPPTERQSIYYSVWQLFRSLQEDKRKEKLNELCRWAGAGSTVEIGRGTVSFQDITALAGTELIDLGSHTVTHPFLSKLSRSEQQMEIQQSKAKLEEILARPVNSFAYPYGGPEDYTAETIELVRKNGFTCACSTISKAVRTNSDSFQLPRMHVQDWNGEEFERHLSNWFQSE